jgi:hypothetical protein
MRRPWPLRHEVRKCAAPGGWLRAAKSYPDAAGSGDKQASAKLCCVEIDEVAVAFGPPA